jgi:hypothetical protein
VICLKTKQSQKEHLFSLDLNNLESSDLIVFQGEVKDLFSREKANISVLRKIDSDFYQDILTSYDSILTQTKAEKKQEKSKMNKGQASKWKRVFKKQIQKNLKKKGELQTFSDSTNINNYTLFSFINIHSRSYLKIKKRQDHVMRDKEDIHVRMTNLQSMKSKFSKITIFPNCSRPVEISPALTFNANSQINRLKKINFLEIPNYEKFNYEFDYESGENKTKYEKNQDINVNWSVNKEKNQSWFFKGI